MPPLDPAGKPGEPAVAPYGTWTSPLTAQAVAAGALRLGHVAVDGDDIYWVEGRPDEGGRSVVGLLVAAPLKSVENFAGVINVVLFPLLFLSGALYPTKHMPLILRTAAKLNPVSYAVDLMRAALGQPSEFGAAQSILALAATVVVLFVATAVVFDPERRVVFRDRPARSL